MQIANADIDDGCFLKLEQLGLRVHLNLDEAEVFLEVRDRALLAQHILEAIVEVGRLCPDECGLEDERVRLWWD